MLAPASAVPSTPGEDGLITADPMHLRIEEVQQGDWELVLRAPARVALEEGARTAVLSTVEGRVTELHVVTGQRVEAGQVLARLQSAEAASARAELRAAEARRNSARDRLARQERLLASGAGLEREVVLARHELHEAEADVSRARVQAAAVGDGRGADIIVRAPVSGVILSRSVTTGSLAGPDREPLFEIGDLSRLWLVADVFEHDLVHLSEGTRVTIDRLPGGVSLEGEVALIGATSEGMMRRTPVHIAPTTPLPEGLRPGMTAQVQFRIPEAESLRVPTPALLIQDGDRTVVYVERERGRFEARPVRVGHRSATEARILEGLQPGERVVTRGALLVDGASDLQL